MAQLADSPTYTRMDVEQRQRVGWLTLNQPDEYNRMPPAFWSEFPTALHGFDASGAVRAVVIASSGKHFTAGMDVSVFTGRAAPAMDAGRAGEAARRHLAHMQSTFSALEALRMPVLAAIQGGCVGGGVDLVSACDMRYCTADAFFCIQEINIGLAADVGTLQRLPKLLPEGLMRELAYTGRRMYADEAKAVGLVNAVFDTQDEMLNAVAALADDIAAKSPLAITSTKQLLNYGRDHSIDDTLQYQQLWMGALSQREEMKRYFEAKRDGQQPDYDDLPPLAAED
ncbi:MAG: crotonase/enoyl-CoA hydratase family protein [Pseudomonadota bacterium]